MQVSLSPLGLLAIPAALAVGTAFGLINGGLIAFGKLPPFIVTLGTLTAVRGLARLLGQDQTVFNETCNMPGSATASCRSPASSVSPGSSSSRCW